MQHGVEQAQQERPDRGHRAAPGRVGSALIRLRGYRIVDLDLATGKPPVGRQIAEIPWPPRSTVLAVRRGEHTFEPAGADRLERGDRLTVLVPAAAADDLVDTITADGDEDRLPPAQPGTISPTSISQR